MGIVIRYYDFLKKIEAQREDAVNTKSLDQADLILRKTEKNYQKLWTWAERDPNCIDEIQKEIDLMNEQIAQMSKKVGK
jgi:hypothetical protein